MLQHLNHGPNPADSQPAQVSQLSDRRYRAARPHGAEARRGHLDWPHPDLARRAPPGAGQGRSHLFRRDRVIQAPYSYFSRLDGPGDSSLPVREQGGHGLSQFVRLVRSSPGTSRTRPPVIALLGLRSSMPSPLRSMAPRALAITSARVSDPPLGMLTVRAAVLGMRPALFLGGTCPLFPPFFSRCCCTCDAAFEGRGVTGGGGTLPSFAAPFPFFPPFLTTCDQASVRGKYL